MRRWLRPQAVMVCLLIRVQVVEAEDDAEFRKRRGRWTGLRLFPVDRYAQVYERQSIDANDANRRGAQPWAGNTVGSAAVMIIFLTFRHRP